MRGFYAADPESFCGAIAHLLGMQHVIVDRWEAVKDAADLHLRGFDFADALHLRCSASCDQFISFDDRRFVRRANRLSLEPKVLLAR